MMWTTIDGGGYVICRHAVCVCVNVIAVQIGPHKTVRTQRTAPVANLCAL